jgi:putative Holliday junction resolvase
MGRILGIDFGEKRIGLAISDELGLTAQGLDTLESKNSKKHIALLKEIIQENKVDKIVVGLPLDRNGNINKDSAVIDFVDRLKDGLKLPIETWDERLSTVEASRILLQADTSRRKRKRVVDKLAAQIILQGYLDYVNAKFRTSSA